MRTRPTQRGVVLLIVVSLLALFILLGVTFTLSVSQYYHASRLEQKDQQYGDLPETEMDLVLGQILYDSAARTVLQYHSLLRDLYGNDLVQGRVELAAGTGAGNIPLGYLNPVNTNPTPGGPTGQFFRFQLQDSGGLFSPIPGYYSGRVITFRTGRAANHSTRIVAYDYNPSATPPVVTITIEAIESKLAGPVWPAPGDEFLINGQPFNGAGLGYDPVTNGTNLQYQANDPANPGNYLLGLSAALLPNLAAYSGRVVDGQGNPAPNGGSIPPDISGLDESWDAVDFQNLFLAMVPPALAEQYQAGNYSLPLIPSFHRPELVNYWINNAPSDRPLSVPALAYTNNLTQHRATQAQRDFLRTFVFRPMPWDHPQFSGSNPFFAGRWDAPANGGALLNSGQLLQNLTGFIDTNGDGTPDSLYPVWDVDNDNDGVPDSIWIDPGLPVITRPDGRRIKRLAAILIKDLDGSINVNAHGTLDQASNPNSHADYALSAAMVPGYAAPPGYALGLAPQNSYAPRGAGFGPAEVNFLGLLTNSNPPTSDSAAVQAYGQLLARRYESKLSGDYWNPPAAVPRPGRPGVRDPLSQVKHWGVPDNYEAGPVAPTWYASPPDVWGRGAVVLDVGGQPLWVNAAARGGEVTDCPYELSLSGESNNADTPYTAAELERLLRYHDPDAVQLPGRLLEAATVTMSGPTVKHLSSELPGVVGVSHSRRNMLTTLSAHIPVPPGLPPQERRPANLNLAPLSAGTTLGQRAGRSSILELYAAVLLAQNPGMRPSQLPRAMRAIVPWEFFHGQKLDLNRWLGDGQDNNGNGAMDEPLEAPSEQAWNTTPAQLTNGLTNDRRMARQLFARHLFCLAMLLGGDALNLPPPPQENTLTAQQIKRLATLRLAQWAINVVDFRDADAIMTPFEFDYTPFHDDDGNPNNGTWDVDGYIGMAPGSDGVPGTPDDVPSADDNQLFRGLVWGAEAPDLLITETLAFHDRRVKDTRYDTTGEDRSASSQPDDDVDQFRIPQGSLFVELYCPRPARWSNAGQQPNQKPALPPELYDASGRLMLSRSPTAGSPIWRLALQKLNKAGDPGHPQRLLGTAPESAAFDPFAASLLPPGMSPAGTTPPQIDRLAYFGDFSSIPPADRPRSYYLQPGSTPSLQPGQYAVVGPRPQTHVGSIAPASGNLWDRPSPQRIVLTPAGVQVFDSNDAPTAPPSGTPAPVRPALGIVLAMFGGPGNPVVPNGWSQAPPWPLGLNITEPLPSGNYYPEPYLMGTAPPGTPPDFYLDDPLNPSSPGTLPDGPLDSPNPLSGQNTAGRPIADQQMAATGTYLDCSAVWLQRLADPTLPYNPLPPDPNFNPSLPVNPYLTVDGMTIDVTVFSGEEDTSRQDANGNPIDPDDPDPRNAQPLNFRSRQRGFPQGRYPLTAPDYLRSNPWPAWTWNGGQRDGKPPGYQYPPTPLQSIATGAPYFNVNLSNNLTQVIPPATYDPATDRHTLGYLNESIEQLAAMANSGSFAQYPGEPNYPFPWLTWNNRPYTSPMELLLVPASTPARLFVEFSILNTGTNQGSQVESLLTTPPSGNTANATLNPFDPSHPNGWRSPFLHLLNFFHSTPISSPPPNPLQLPSPLLFRLLEYVEVPSPYQGAERWYNPQVFATDATGQYYPPFSKLSRFRDAGRVNLNTIFDPRVWDALVARFPGLSEQDSQTPGFFTQHVALSRQGYAGGLYSLNPQYPTRFANPFRAAHASDLMPNVGSGPAAMRKTNPVEATLLRPDPTDNTKPLFQVRRDDPRWYDPQGPGALPGPPLTTSGIHQDIHRNPYFRYLPLQKLGNLVTTQSNCFAVWITIGYFEVEPVAVDPAHPDGYTLGQEVGADSGEITRHRAFFIIDRSVPVGFLPGSRLNTDECILVRRLIE